MTARRNGAAADTVVLQNARLFDPALGIDRRGDVVLHAGTIDAIGEALTAPAGARVLDLGGALLVPGLVDMHVHLREPGREDAETIATGARAAAAGGFTDILAMPNTTPPADSAETVAFVRSAGERAGGARVHPCGAITRGLAGEELAPAHELVAAGARALSDDGRPVSRAEVMRRALEYARPLGVPVITHAEDLSLRGDGVMHEGFVSTSMGLRGIPAACEEVAIARDVTLARLAGAALHVAHVSTSGGVDAIRRARAAGERVTGEVTPHHLALTDEAVRGYDTHAKMNPPLRSADHRDALIEGLRDGTLTVIATDHAPHGPHDKDVEFDVAAFGVIGVESAAGVVLTRCVRTGAVDLTTVVRAFTDGPRAVLGLPPVRLAPGAPADLTAIDLDEAWTVDARTWLSLSRNTPFAGWSLVGRPLLTVVGGTIVFQRAAAGVGAA